MNNDTLDTPSDIIEEDFSSDAAVDEILNLKEITRSTIDSRNHALSLYADVMNYLSQEQGSEASVTLREVLEDLCEQLVDYTGKIHFSLSTLLEDDPQNKGVSDLLIENTQKILDFHDSYNSDVIEIKVDNLPEKLNRLGEVMAERALLEDKLLDVLLLEQ
ncbi:MAG: Rsd/AlgQ family anti-sigma factor [Gammaproteobacteria bacterium]|nr:Rsd/AlgQ family anti-sigma factor [Gammaproteobacteria bacterium]